MEKGNMVGVSPPPEGALVGESVPRENTLTEREESMIEEVANQMVSKGEPYTLMSQGEREEKAKELLQSNGVIR